MSCTALYAKHGLTLILLFCNTLYTKMWRLTLFWLHVSFMTFIAISPDFTNLYLLTSLISHHMNICQFISYLATLSMPQKCFPSHAVAYLSDLWCDCILNNSQSSFMFGIVSLNRKKPFQTILHIPGLETKVMFVIAVDLIHSHRPII